MPTEAQALAHAFDRARNLTRWYISKMKDVDMTREFEVNGTRLNSALWICGHLCWSENMLLLQALGAKGQNLPWLEQFRFGKGLEQGETTPDIKTILDGMKAIHADALQHLNSLSDEKMDEPNVAGISFGESNDYRAIIHHAIRHEAGHAGQLGWLCKLYGLQTV